MKKLLSTLLALIMLITTLTATGVNVFASSYSGWCGENARWTVDSEKNELIISGSGPMYDYRGGERPPWNNYLDWPYSVKVDGVSEIGAYSWDGQMLDSVYIGSSVRKIGALAFRACSIKSITIEKGLKTIGGAFVMTGFPKIALKLPDTVTTIEDGAFQYSSGMKSISIPASVTSIGNLAFSGSIDLTAINVNSSNKKYSSKDGVLFNKNKTTLIQVPVGKKITSYTVPSTVKKIGDRAFAPFSHKPIHVFGFAKTLKTVIIPNSVTSVGELTFTGCQALTKLVLSTNLKKIPFDFAYNCKSLKGIYIPPSVTSIGNNAFGEYYDEATYSTKYVKDFKMYSKNNKAAIAYAKKYSNITHKTVSAVPKLAFKSVTAVSKGFKASWTKNTKMDGYQIQYATDSKFTKNKKTVTETDETKASKTIKNLTAKKKYYVRVRNYKRYAGAQVFSAWSGTKSVTTKK